MKITLLFLFLWFCQTLAATTQKNGPAAIRRVKEGEDVILPCSLGTWENITQGVFDWKKEDQKKKDGLEVFFYDAGVHYNNGRDGQDEQFKGRVSHFQDELEHGDASIIIKNTKISDSGNYTCHFPHLQPNGQKTHVELIVEPIDRDRSGEIRGAAREPYIRTNITEDGVLLQCDVRDASPKPEVEWQDSAGHILPAEEPQVIKRGDRYDVTLLTTVTKSDHFRCVVRQKEINHVISAETYVPFPEKRCEVWTGWLGGLVLGATVTAVIAALLHYFRISRNKGSHQQMNRFRNGASHVPLTPNGSSHVPLTPNGSSHVPLTPNGSSHVPLAPNGSSHVPLTPNGSSHVPLIPNGSSHVPLIPNGSSHVPLIPEPHQNGDDKSNGAV